MKFLLPHVVIVFAITMLVRSSGSEATAITLFVAGHLAVPIWCGLIAKRAEKTRALVLGPVLVIGIHLAAILALFAGLVGGFPEDTWLGRLLGFVWLALVAIYTAYAMIAFGIASRVRTA